MIRTPPRILIGTGFGGQKYIMAENASLIISDGTKEVAKRLDNAVMQVVSSKAEGFEKAYIQAAALEVISNALTDEYMKPIMLLQNKKIGFLTDAKDGGYSLQVVREVVMEATLYGLQVTGNQFNIISSRMYITKEGFAYLLRKLKERVPSFSYDNPTFKVLSNENAVATVLATISWKIGGEKKIAQATFSVASGGAKTDAIIGKAERKANKWLYTEITKQDLPDGEAEIQETTYTIVTEEEAPASNTEIPAEEPKKEETPMFPNASAEDQLTCDNYIKNAKNKTELHDRFQTVRNRKPGVIFDTKVFESLSKSLPEA